jgi:hypothetical protein
VGEGVGEGGGEGAAAFPPSTGAGAAAPPLAPSPVGAGAPFSAVAPPGVFPGPLGEVLVEAEEVVPAVGAELTTVVDGTTPATAEVEVPDVAAVVPPAPEADCTHDGWLAASTAMMPRVADTLRPVAMTRPVAAGWGRRRRSAITRLRGRGSSRLWRSAPRRRARSSSGSAPRIHRHGRPSRTSRNAGFSGDFRGQTPNPPSTSSFWPLM